MGSMGPGGSTLNCQAVQPLVCGDMRARDGPEVEKRSCDIRVREAQTLSGPTPTGRWPTSHRVGGTASGG